MRNAFASAMTQIANEHSDVCLLSGDIGNRMFDEFKEVAPERFFNCGIAESNMMSMAAGMGLSGLRPVVYTIAPFTTTRCLEQIRTGVAYHGSPVVIVGTGSGLSYAELGATHHSLEDIAILRSIPNFQICAPADSLELTSQLKDALLNGIPTYIRIGKKGEPILHHKDSVLRIGKAKELVRGESIALIGVGPILSEALKANEILMSQGTNISIVSMGSIKPLDEQFLQDLINRGFSKWISLEEHNKIGGLGSALLEWLSEKQINSTSLIRMGINDHFVNHLGNQTYVRQMENLDHESIVKLIKKL